MTDFIEYIEASCKGLSEGRLTYLYKRSVLDGMKQRAKELLRTGLTDEKVISDLIINEYGDLKAGYGTFVKKQKQKERAHIMKYALPIGGVVALLLVFIAYFTVSRFTYAWDKTWLVIVGGIFAMIFFYFSLAIKKLCTMGHIFRTAARVLIAGCVMLLSVFIFLCLLMLLPENTVTWPALPLGVALMLLCDLAFSYATKQKFRTISFFVYMPAVAAMAYIVLAAYGVVSWAGGWPVVLVGLVADLAYIFAVLAYNMKYFVFRQEADE